MKVLIRLCDQCALDMIYSGFDVEPLKSYVTTKGTRCNNGTCEFRGYPRQYRVEIAPVGVLV